MTFNELVLTTENDFKYLNSFLERADIFVEATEREYEKNLSAINLRIITEDGTEEDKQELNDAAKESYFEKFKKFMNKLINTIVEKLNAIGQNIAQFFMQAKVKLALKILGTLSKKYPNKTIEIEDIPDIVGFYEKHEAEFLKKISQYMSKGENPISANVNAYDDMMKKFYIDKKYLRPARQKIKVTIGQAKDMLEKFSAKALNFIKKSASRAREFAKVGWERFSSSAAAMVRQGILLFAKLAKEGANDCWNAIKSLFSRIRGKAETPNIDASGADEGEGSSSDDKNEDKEDKSDDNASDDKENKSEDKPEEDESDEKDSDEDSEDESEDKSDDESDDEDSEDDDEEKEDKKKEDKDEKETEESANLDHEIEDIMNYLDIKEEFMEDDSDDFENYINTPEGYLEAMEYELFGDEYDMYEESSRSNVDNYIDRLIVSMDR